MAGHKGSARKKAPPAPSVPAGLPRPNAVRLLGVSDRTFRRLESEGVIAPAVAGDGRRPSMYDGPTLVAAYLAHRERQLTGSNESPRDRKDRSQAELNELRLARERKELLPREQVVLEGQAFIKATMAKLRAIPSRLVRAGVIPRTSETVVAELVREAQEEMARWQNAIDLERALDEKT